MYHDDAKPNENQIHIPHNWTFTNATDRLNTTLVFTSAHVDKLALQLDDYSLWMLTSINPVTWVQQTIGTVIQSVVNNTSINGNTSFINITPSVPVGGHRIIVGLSTGYELADNTNLDHFGKVLGITTSATNGVNSTNLITGNYLTEQSWSFALGNIFVGTNGMLTQTVPTVGFIQQIATAISPTEIIVNIKPPIKLLGI